MEVLGGREDELLSDCDDGSTDDEMDVLNQPYGPKINRAKRLLSWRLLTYCES